MYSYVHWKRTFLLSMLTRPAVAFPRYATYSGDDYRSNECMRQNFEPLYYTYGVDVQLHGALVPCLRVHSYMPRPVAPR